jgi:hypothetical protein
MEPPRAIEWARCCRLNALAAALVSSLAPVRRRRDAARGSSIGFQAPRGVAAAIAALRLNPPANHRLRKFAMSAQPLKGDMRADI